MEILIIIVCAVNIIAIILIFLRHSKPNNESALLINKIDVLHSSIKEDFRTNREEIITVTKDNRIELNNTLKGFQSELSQTLRNITEQNERVLREVNKTLAEKVDLLTSKIEYINTANREALSTSLKDFTLEQRNNFNDLRQELKELTTKTVDNLEKITVKVEQKLGDLTKQANADNNQMRESLTNSFKGFQENFDKNVASFNELQREKFAQLETRQGDLVKATEIKLETIRSTVEEKLEKTLSERLGQSFETVGKQLIEVQRGLGEMQTIASDVGGLKKVLSNVKLRGGIGEVQLAMLLEQILAPSQYDANVRTKAGSMEPVEFAIKLPGKSEDEESCVYLPIDAKFPKDVYEHLIIAYENAIPEDIEAATKYLEGTIRKMAKDIRDKYIDPPNTTDFAILFLPFESIYAEVIRRSALVDQLRDEFKITVAGPTTLAALLNSLQMGFRTLALQKRSSEVWEVLGGVKTEFEKFGGLLEKAQKNIQTGLGQLDDVVGTRTRAIQRQLRSVVTLPAIDEKLSLPEILEDGLDSGIGGSALSNSTE